MENIPIQEILIPQLPFNPWLAFTGLRTTRPRPVKAGPLETQALNSASKPYFCELSVLKNTSFLSSVNQNVWFQAVSEN